VLNISLEVMRNWKCFAHSLWSFTIHQEHARWASLSLPLLSSTWRFAFSGPILFAFVTLQSCHKFLMGKYTLRQVWRGAVCSVYQKILERLWNGLCQSIFCHLGSCCVLNSHPTINRPMEFNMKSCTLLFNLGHCWKSALQLASSLCYHIDNQEIY
jgi:hypothetical protein